MNTYPFDTHKLIEACRQNDVVKIGVFGSMARGEANEQSDIDLIVEFSKPLSSPIPVGGRAKWARSA